MIEHSCEHHGLAPLQLAYVMMADMALVDPVSGKLYVLGGGIDTLLLTAFPGIQPALALICAVTGDLRTPRQLRVVLLDPAGSTVILDTAGTIGGSAPAPSSAQTLQQLFVFQLHQLRLPTAGDYRFHLLADGAELGVVPLHVRQVVAPG